MTSDAPIFIDRGDGVRIACRHRPGREATIVFLPGYQSDMAGAKAVALDGWAERAGQAMLRLDFSGTGESEGAFEDGTLDRWRDDALAAIDQLTDGPLLLVGSSMGGWLALHIAMLRPDRVRGIVGIAAAPDFTEWGFPDHLKRRLTDGETLRRQSEYGGEQVTTAGFWRSGQAMRLLDGPIAATCPMRLVHGDCDGDVPIDVAMRIKDRVRSADVQLLIVKDGGHRLSERHEIDAILRTVGALVEQVR